MRVSISLRLAQTDWAEASAYVTEAEFNKIVDPTKMVRPYVATE